MLIAFSLRGHFVGSKSGFHNLLPIEMLLLTTGQELQVFSSLTSAPADLDLGNCVNSSLRGESFAQCYL